MIEFTEEELLKKIEEEEISILAFAITPWHALGVEACIYNIMQEESTLKGYVLIIDHPITGRALTEENFRYSQSLGIQVAVLKSGSTKRTIFEKIKNKVEKYSFYCFPFLYRQYKQPLYLLKPLEPYYEMVPKICKINCNLKIYITDEGLGSYLNSPLTWWKSIFIEAGIKRGILSTWHLFVRNPYFNRVLRRFEYRKFQLLTYQNKTWVENQEAVIAFRKIMEFDQVKTESDFYGNAIVINSDMLYACGALSEDADLAQYKKISEFAAKTDTTLILKPHPRETKLDRYQELVCMIDTRYELAQEAILSGVASKPLCVIGLGSTTLVTAKLFFDIETISLNKIIGTKNLLKNKKYFEPFNRTFGNVIFIPETEEELYKKLEEIKKNHESY